MLLGVVLSSDKTNTSAMTGGHITHPLLLSLANLNTGFHMKASNHAFLLLTLLPVPKFIHTNSKIHGILKNHLLYECLDFILEPLKIATCIGIMMSNVLGILGMLSNMSPRLHQPHLLSCKYLKNKLIHGTWRSTSKQLRHFSSMAFNEHRAGRPSLAGVNQ